MVDRVYKANIPALRRSLERLKSEFSRLKTRTDWTRLRVDPLLQHAKQLERRLRAQGSSRLARGVSMFHSDLVYLQENVQGLKRVLQSETKSLARKIKPARKRAR